MTCRFRAVILVVLGVVMLGCVGCFGDSRSFECIPCGTDGDCYVGHQCVSGQCHDPDRSGTCPVPKTEVLKEALKEPAPKERVSEKGRGETVVDGSKDGGSKDGQDREQAPELNGECKDGDKRTCYVRIEEPEIHRGFYRKSTQWCVGGEWKPCE